MSAIYKLENGNKKLFNINTDRQTDRQTDKQIDRQVKTDRQITRHIDCGRHRFLDGLTDTKYIHKNIK